MLSLLVRALHSPQSHPTLFRKCRRGRQSRRPYHPAPAVTLVPPPLEAAPREPKVLRHRGGPDLAPGVSFLHAPWGCWLGSEAVLWTEAEPGCQWKGQDALGRSQSLRATWPSRGHDPPMVSREGRPASGSPWYPLPRAQQSPSCLAKPTFLAGSGWRVGAGPQPG